MPLSVREPPYKIPEYSLTGDLLAYLTCGLQYRYHNKGSLPPSTPVQLWFGEFIHSVMEEAYLEWQQNQQRRRFPWSWDPEVRDIELQINRRLRARGLSPPPRLFCPYDSSFTQQGWCPDPNHPHQLIASQRTEAAINTWGQHLFPLIDEAEVRLKSIRDMSNYRHGVSRCNYYGITGVVDVISSVDLQNAPSGNLILHYISQNPELQEIINNLASPEYEIIIDYKGMRRPPINDPTWQHHEWQILTYAWLRTQQPQSRPIVAGIIFYLNELALSQEDIRRLQNDVRNNSTDIVPQGLDSQAIQNWRRNTTPPTLSRPFKEQRSIKIISVDDIHVQNSLQAFDNVVGDIESCVLSEMAGRSITSSWNPNPIERNCTACDFKTFCSNPAPRRYHPTVP
jgi:CRISPR/Cas system-associated exonuclease Cas4 (RecB family)